MKRYGVKRLNRMMMLGSLLSIIGYGEVVSADVQTIDYSNPGALILNSTTTEVNILTGANVGGLISGGSSAGVLYQIQDGTLNALQTSIGGNNDIRISGGTMTTASGSTILSFRGVDFLRMTGGTLTGNIDAGSATGTALIYIDGGVLNGDIHDSSFNDQMLIRGNAVINGEWYEQGGSDLLLITNNARLNGGIHGGNGGDILRIEENAVVTGNVNLENDDDQIFISGNAQVNGNIFSGGGNDIIRISGNASALSGVNLNISGTQTLYMSDQATVGWIVGANNVTSHIFISDQAHVKTDTFGGALSIRTDNQPDNSIYLTMTGGTLDGGMQMLGGGVHSLAISGGTVGVTGPSKMALANTSIELSSVNDTLQMTGGILQGGINGANNLGTLDIFVGGTSQVGQLSTGDSIIGGSLSSQITIADQAQITGNIQANNGGSVAIAGGNIAGDVLIGNSGTVTQTSGTVAGDLLTTTGGATVTLAGGNVVGNLQGGAGDDVFVGSGGLLGGTVSGGGGNDLFQVTKGLYRVDDMESLAISGGAVKLNQMTYTNLTTSGQGTIYPGSGNTIFSGDVFHGGLIDLSVNGAPTDSITMSGNYVGQSGVFKLNALMGISSSSVDQIFLTGPVSGTTYLDIKGTAPSTLAPMASVLVVDANGAAVPSDTFRLRNPQVQVGFHNYVLINQGSQWFLDSVGISPVVLGYNKNLLGNYNLTRELLDFPKESKEEWNPWGRYIGKSYELSTIRRSYGANLHGFQAGIDRRIYQNENQTKAAYLGAFAGYGHSSMDYGIKDTGETTGDGWHGGLYGIYQQKIGEKNRFHLDGSVLWGHQGTMKNISGLSGAYEEYDADLWGANLNAYYSIAGSSGWRWEPGMKLSYGSVSHGDPFSEDSGLKVEKGRIDGLYGALNLKLIKEQTTSTGRYFAPYIKGEIGTNLSGGDAVTVINGIAFREKSDNLTGSLGVGFTYEASKRHRWTFEVNRLMGAEKGWQGSGMIQFYW